MESRSVKGTHKATGLIAIVVIFILELFAVHKGIDGKALALAIAAVAGLGGFTIGKIFK